MPDFPQPSNGQLVEFANYRSIAKAGSVTAVAANNGDYILVDATTSGATVTLPPVAFGGPVGVKIVTAATGAGGTTIVTSDSSTIDGYPGATGLVFAALNQAVVLASDGVSKWYTVGGVGATLAES